jgi:hypothetical protein
MIECLWAQSCPRLKAFKTPQVTVKGMVKAWCILWLAEWGKMTWLGYEQNYLAGEGFHWSTRNVLPKHSSPFAAASMSSQYRIHQGQSLHVLADARQTYCLLPSLFSQ